MPTGAARLRDGLSYPLLTQALACISLHNLTLSQPVLTIRLLDLSSAPPIIKSTIFRAAKTILPFPTIPSDSPPVIGLLDRHRDLEG